MKALQKKIESGFGHNTTAKEILNGQNMSGKIAIITGGYSGLGLEATRALSDVGVQVIVPARSLKKAKENLKEIPLVEIAHLELTDPLSINNFADSFLKSGRKIDILINGAGIMATPLQRDARGYEMQFSANHLGHFHLTSFLWPALVRSSGARVISVSSAGHQLSDIRWNDINFKNEYDKWLAYGQSKTAIALFSVWLDKIGKDFGVRAFSLHPGKILTPLQRHLDKDEMMSAGWIDKDGNLVDPEFKTPQQGAATAIWAATSPQLNNMGGVYCEDCDIAPIKESPEEISSGVSPWATDIEAAERLWKLSEEMIGISFSPKK